MFNRKLKASVSDMKERVYSLELNLEKANQEIISLIANQVKSKNLYEDLEIKLTSLEKRYNNDRHSIKEELRKINEAINDLMKIHEMRKTEATSGFDASVFLNKNSKAELRTGYITIEEMAVGIGRSVRNVYRLLKDIPEANDNRFIILEGKKKFYSTIIYDQLQKSLK